MNRNRQWMLVGMIVGALLVPVVLGFLNRERFSPIDVGVSAPEVHATDLSGNSVRLSDYSGKVVLLNIWATWCPPCVEEMPSMERLYQQVDHPDFEILAVSIDAGIGEPDRLGNRGGDVRMFVDEFGLTFPIWLDPDAAVRRSYRATAVPETFVIGRDGRILKKVIGGTMWDSPANIELIQRLLGDEVALTPRAADAG